MLLTEQGKAAKPALSPSGMDPSGLDLSGVDLPGGNLCGAMFERMLAGITARGASLPVATIGGVDLDRSNFINADFSDASVEHIYVRTTSARDTSFVRVTGGSLHFINSGTAGAETTNLSPKSTGYENIIPDGVRFAGTSFDRTGFVPIDLARADLGAVRSAQFFPGFALGNMAGLDLRGLGFFGQYPRFPAAERRRRVARSRRRRELRPHPFFQLEF